VLDQVGCAAKNSGTNECPLHLTSGLRAGGCAPEARGGYQEEPVHTERRAGKKTGAGDRRCRPIKNPGPGRCKNAAEGQSTKRWRHGKTRVCRPFFGKVFPKIQRAVGDESMKRGQSTEKKGRGTKKKKRLDLEGKRKRLGVR